MTTQQEINSLSEQVDKLKKGSKDYVKQKKELLNKINNLISSLESKKVTLGGKTK
jgi:hypothetical protein